MFGDAVYTWGVKQEFCAMLDYDPWPTAPVESDPEYYRTWQRVSVVIQTALRVWALELFLRAPERCEDRDDAAAMIVYAASRPFYGRSKPEFTWDPADTNTLERALHGIGAAIQRTLGRVEMRLRDCGYTELACRYSPVWHLDILLAARHRPKPLVALLAREARLIEAVIGWGTERSESAALRFLRVANSSLRNFHGIDMTGLVEGVMKETTISIERTRRELAECRERWKCAAPLD